MKHRYNALLSQTWDLRDERQIMSLLEEAIVIADRYLTEEDAYRARMQYTEKAVEFGYYDKMLVSFIWCWSRFVKHPEKYSSFYMLWHFKWVVENMRKFAVYSLAQLEQLFALFKEECEKYQYSLRPYYEAYMHLLLYSGRTEEAGEYYKLWRKAKHDGLSNCQACEQHAMGGYHFSKGHYKRGLQLLKPVLEGRLTCHSVPGNTYAMVVQAYLALGQFDEARKYAEKAYRALKGTGHHYEYGTLIAYYTVVNRRRAMQLYRNSRRDVKTTVNDWEKLHYLVGVQFLLEQQELEQTRKRKPNPDELDYEWVCAEIDRLRKAFDARNQNSYMSRRIEDMRKLYAGLKEMAGNA
jgi:tetratricopeptide (TPR) repeat protein